MRLVGSRGNCVGRVELFYQGVWGTVCDDLWDLPEANIVCKQLGCGWAVAAPGEAHFGKGSGKILLDNVHCRGDEGHLQECSHVGWFSHNCEHGEDAGVICSGNARSRPSRARLWLFPRQYFSKDSVKITTENQPVHYLLTADHFNPFCLQMLTTQWSRHQVGKAILARSVYQISGEEVLLGSGCVLLSKPVAMGRHGISRLSSGRDRQRLRDHVAPPHDVLLAILRRCGSHTGSRFLTLLYSTLGLLGLRIVRQ